MIVLCRSSGALHLGAHAYLMGTSSEGPRPTGLGVRKRSPRSQIHFFLNSRFYRIAASATKISFTGRSASPFAPHLLRFPTDSPLGHVSCCRAERDLLACPRAVREREPGCCRSSSRNACCVKDRATESAASSRRRLLAAPSARAPPAAALSLSLSLHAARSVAPHTQGEGGEEEGAVSAELCIRRSLPPC